MKYFFFLSLMAIFGCAHTNVNERENHENIIRKKAVYDLDCVESQLSVTGNETKGYLVECDDKKATFKVKCSLGPCWAKKIK